MSADSAQSINEQKHLVAREKLEAQQTALLQALTTDLKIDGFKHERLEATSLSLQQKRMRTLQRAHPCIANAVGRSFEELFIGYAKANSLPSAHSTDDAAQFVEYLAQSGCLEPALWRAYWWAVIWKTRKSSSLLLVKLWRRLCIAVKQPAWPVKLLEVKTEVMAACRVRKRTQT